MMEFITVWEVSKGVFKWLVMNGTKVLDESAGTFSEYGLAAADAMDIYNLPIK